MNGGLMLPPTLARIRQLQEDEVFSICNVGPWDYRLERGALLVYVPAYDAAEDSAKLGYAASDPRPVIQREAKIINEDEYGYFEDDGHQVALDLIGVGFGLPGSNSLLQYGVFVPAGNLPTKDEIAEARKRLSGCIDNLIQDARDAYDKGPAERKAVINERHLWAARQRGITEPWVHYQHSQQSIRCESCGQFCPDDVARCRCGNIINFDIEKRNLIRRKQQERELGELELEIATAPPKKK